MGAGEEATKLHASRTLLLVGEEAVVVQDRVAGEGEERGELGGEEGGVLALHSVPMQRPVRWQTCWVWVVRVMGGEREGGVEGEGEEGGGGGDVGVATSHHIPSSCSSSNSTYTLSLHFSHHHHNNTSSSGSSQCHHHSSSSSSIRGSSHIRCPPSSPHHNNGIKQSLLLLRLTVHK